MSNRYKTRKQTLPIAAWLIGACVASCVVGFGIKYLMVQYQVIQGGKKVKELETRLADLNVKNDDLQSRIDELTGREALKGKIAGKFLNMREIVTDKDVIYAGRKDKRVEWKDGAPSVANIIPTGAPRVAETGGAQR